MNKVEYKTWRFDRTDCYRPADDVVEIYHPQGGGEVDRELRLLCEIHAKEHTPQNVSHISEWEIERLAAGED